jgi:hypothetical protein
MNDLTAKLNQFFDDSIFIPVSLKKIGGRDSDSFDIIINGEKVESCQFLIFLIL